MAAPSGVIWDLLPHTATKHEILRLYLGAWFSDSRDWHCPDS